MGASREASVATITTAGIDKRGLAGVNLQDGFAAADLAGQTLVACLAEIIYDHWYVFDLSFGHVYGWHISPSASTAWQIVVQCIPPWGIYHKYSRVQKDGQTGHGLTIFHLLAPML